MQTIDKSWNFKENISHIKEEQNTAQFFRFIWKMKNFSRGDDAIYSNNLNFYFFTQNNFYTLKKIWNAK